MAFHDHPLYESIEQIPEVVPRQLWLPVDSPARIVKAPETSSATTSPLEVSFSLCRLNAQGLTSAEEATLDLFLEGYSSPREYLEENMGNHFGRVVFRAVFDPDRHAPINFLDAYHRESRRRGYSETEAQFFANFVENWGVIKRT